MSADKSKEVNRYEYLFYLDEAWMSPRHNQKFEILMNHIAKTKTNIKILNKK